jgi:alpha-1,6-mannosyltransferase
VIVDSYFWDNWAIWPEINTAIFNVLEGRNVEWGVHVVLCAWSIADSLNQVSPAHAYFSSFLPKMLLGGLPLAIAGVLLEPSALSPVYPGLAYVAAISVLGHKEWRFIVYVLPIFNVAASRGAVLL